MSNLFRSVLGGVAMVVLPLQAGAVELVMVHQAGCQYCLRWTEEIGPIYPKTAKGRFAPLKRVELGSAEMDDLALERRVNFTPTFILVDDGGTEMARLEGYPGEDFFWGILEQILIKNAGFSPSQDGGS